MSQVIDEYARLLNTEEEASGTRMVHPPAPTPVRAVPLPEGSGQARRATQYPPEEQGSLPNLQVDDRDFENPHGRNGGGQLQAEVPAPQQEAALVRIRPQGVGKAYTIPRKAAAKPKSQPATGGNNLITFI